MIKNFIVLLVLLINLHLVFAQTCLTTFSPDLPLQSSSSVIQGEIDKIYNDAKNTVLQNNIPNTTAVNSATAAYNNLNISVVGGIISGNLINNYNQVSFIGVLAEYLKYYPNDLSIKEKAKNTIWWVYENICSGNLAPDLRGYEFRNFGRKAAFCLEILDASDKQRFLFIMEKNSKNWNIFWKPQLTDGEFDSDFIYNNLDTLIATVKCFSTYDEQYRYMMTLKRYIKRFTSEFTEGTKDGMKPDGSGYHHWNNYQAYMYAYNTVIEVMKMLNGTSFQIDSSAYLIFRDAVLHKQFIANDNDIVPLSITGRSGNWDYNTMPSYLLKDLANMGGQILGLSTADPILAGIYNRKYGVDPSFNYFSISPFETGFYQINHHNTAIFRTKNCVVVNKGFNNQLWGSEIYPNSNRYGRYQSYGAMSIVYPGTKETNGFSNVRWDWNYNPGATTKILPWEKLIAGWERLDELSNKRFAGALQFNLKNNGILNKVYGTSGIFAMDFQEKKDLGFNLITAIDTHDPTFVFKKSSFFFDDMIICLASNISNIDNNHTTITTLYQNSTMPADVYINDNLYSLTEITSTYSSTNNHWILDNFGTGYYITAGSGNIKIKRSSQQSPSHDQINPSILNISSQAAIAYMDHGNAPLNKEYEYVVVPNTTKSFMQTFAQSFQNTNLKPYIVLNKTENAHIIKHKGSETYGFALFQSNNVIPANTNIFSNDFPCLIMYQPNSTNTQMKLSLSNPDLGLLGSRSLAPFTPKLIRITLNGNWQLAAPNPDINLVSYTGDKSIFEFNTYQGLPIESIFYKTIPILAVDNVINKKDRLVIYPNPASDILHVKTKSLIEWRIVDVNGIDVLHGKNFDLQFEINISQLPAGAYFFIVKAGRDKIKFIKI